MARARKTTTMQTWPQERWVVDRRAGQGGRRRGTGQLGAWCYDGAFDRAADVRAHLNSYLLFWQADQDRPHPETFLQVLYGWIDRHGNWVSGPEKVYPGKMEVKE